jgi:hypothetical protein
MSKRERVSPWLGNGAESTGVVRIQKTYSVDPDIHARVARYAELNRYTLGQVVECALTEFLEKRCD